MRMMCRVGRRQSGAVKAATGERIVAFGRVGKPPENPFLQAFAASATGRRIAGNADILQRLFKPHGVGLGQGNF
jgi:hypothetical protein